MKKLQIFPFVCFVIVWLLYQYSHTSIPPSLISLMVSVDVKHHVYLVYTSPSKLPWSIQTTRSYNKCNPFISMTSGSVNQIFSVSDEWHVTNGLDQWWLLFFLWSYPTVWVWWTRICGKRGKEVNLLPFCVLHSSERDSALITILTSDLGIATAPPPPVISVFSSFSSF